MGAGEVIRIRVTSSSPTSLDRFVTAYGKHRGLRMVARNGDLAVTLDADRIEVLGPIVEAAAAAADVVITLADLDAAVLSAGLEGRPSRIWAAIGNAADERAAAHDRGVAPPSELFRYVRVDMVDGQRVALDDRAPLLDNPGPGPIDAWPKKYDDVGWHQEGAENAGQPIENASTHIALYLTWLIRHDLIEPGFIPRPYLEAVKKTEIAGTNVMNRIDGKLVSDLMTDDGASCSDEYYKAYLEEYGGVFADQPDYGVVGDESAFDRIAPTIERAWLDWRTRHGKDSPGRARLNQNLA
jgi:hypothetical protein